MKEKVWTALSEWSDVCKMFLSDSHSEAGV